MFQHMNSMFSRSKAPKTQQAEHCQHPRKTSDLARGLRQHLQNLSLGSFAKVSFCVHLQFLTQLSLEMAVVLSSETDTTFNSRNLTCIYKHYIPLRFTCAFCMAECSGYIYDMSSVNLHFFLICFHFEEKASYSGSLICL